MVAAEAEAATPTPPVASRAGIVASPRSRAAPEHPGSRAWRPAKKTDGAFSRPEYIGVGPERSTLAETLHGGDAHDGYTQFVFAQGPRYVGKNFSAGGSPFAGGFSRPEYMDSGPRTEGSGEKSPRIKGRGFYMHRCALARGICASACGFAPCSRVWRFLPRRPHVARLTPNAFLLCSDCASPLPIKMNNSFLSVPEHTAPGGDVYAAAPTNGIACGLPISRGMQARANMGLFPLCFGSAAASSPSSFSSCCACPNAAKAPAPASRRVAAKPRTGRQQRVVPKASRHCRRRLSAGRCAIKT